MLTFTLGTFAIALNHLLLISALALATFVGWRVAKRGGDNPESALFSLFLLGMLAARIAFVVLYWSHYRNDPWQIIDLRDGGFLAWPGVIVLLLAAFYRGWRRPGLRRPLGFGVASGVVFWLLATLSLNIYEQGTRLPDISLRNAAGETIQLSDYQGGPLVINLWATWCPPCRREMPVLESAQQQRPDLTFLFVNQAESMQSVATFLETQGLSLNNVLFDRRGQLGQAVGSMALPTTLFYSPDGRLLASHLGELSNASLARALENFGEPTPHSTPATAPATSARKLPCPASATC
ncbi:TlpA disulfide reductase family protein [Pseudomonas sp. NPDC087690]|jgi:thiol-disulfide isomerase/thioredoxin|uniref:prolipoprotein diacylglyceryl transferase family protein n=1 Tax=Pseudomonas sp. NPDC087690 TaxID=3364446 RepID=UPI000F06B333